MKEEQENKSIPPLLLKKRLIELFKKKESPSLLVLSKNLRSH